MSDVKELLEREKAVFALVRELAHAPSSAGQDARMWKAEAELKKIREEINTAVGARAALASPPLSPQEPVAWEEAQRISDVLAVKDAMQSLIDDPTADNATCVVREVIDAARPQPALPPTDLIEPVAKTIYEQWAHIPGYRPWVDGGNAFKQDDARQLARKAIGEPA